MLTENDVVEAVAKHLKDQGWEIIERADTHQRGHDILARRDGSDLVVEAKGGTTSKNTPGLGRPFTSSQKQTPCSQSLLHSRSRIQSMTLPTSDRAALN